MVVQNNIKFAMFINRLSPKGNLTYQVKRISQGGFGILKKYIGSISDVCWAQEFEFERIEVTRPTVAEIWEGEKVWEQLPFIGRTTPYKASHVRVSFPFVADEN